MLRAVEQGGSDLGWRETVREVAHERATAESLELWGQPRGEQPRFNYRWEHLRAVERLSSWLGRELGADDEVLTAAVWLHDLVKSHEPGMPEVSDSETAAAEARVVLESTDFPPSKIDRVCEAIRTHEGLTLDRPLEALESAILWDADKLSKLGAIHLVHNLCVRTVFDPIFQGRPTDTDLVISGEEAWLAISAGIVASMNTEPARLEAARRLDFLKTFMQELNGEWETIR